MRKVGYVLGLALATGCATSHQDSDVVARQHRVVTRQQQQEGAAQGGQQTASQSRDWVSSHADGTATGRIAEMSSDSLKLESYGGDEESRNFRVERRFPVFTAESGRSSAGLGAGDDVRVFYRHTDDGMPEVIGIEKLSPDDARSLHDAVTPGDQIDRPSDNATEPPTAPREHFPADDQTERPTDGD